MFIEHALKLIAMKKPTKLSYVKVLLLLPLVFTGCNLFGLFGSGGAEEAGLVYNGPITDHTWRWVDVTTTSEDPVAIYEVFKLKYDSLAAVIEFHNDFTYQLTSRNDNNYEGVWDFGEEDRDFWIDDLLMTYTKLTKDTIEAEGTRMTESGDYYDYKLTLIDSSIPQWWIH